MLLYSLAYTKSALLALNRDIHTLSPVKLTGFKFAFCHLEFWHCY